MKSAPQSHSPSSTPTPTTPGPSAPASPDASSPLASLIPAFLRRPTHHSRPSVSSRSRSRSSSTATLTRTPPPSEASESTVSSRLSSDALGLLDDDPFACSWTVKEHPLPAYSLPSSPLHSPTKESFLSLDAISHTLSHSQDIHQFPILSDCASDERSVTADARDDSILPLHRRERPFTLKPHPRNLTWQSDKPAFQKRPSLPPLSILAQQNIFVVAPKSSRARQFPSEPWDKDASELLPFPKAKTPSPTASLNTGLEVALGRLDYATKELPRLPDHYEVPLHPSPIPELEEDEETSHRLSLVEEELGGQGCLAPPSSPDIEFLDLEEPVPREVAPRDLSPHAQDGSDASRLTMTASIAIAISLVQESHKEVVQDSCRPNTQFATSPSPSSCLLPSPNPPALPELSSSRTSGSTVSTDDTDAECKTDEEGLDTYTSFWKHQQDGESPPRSRSPISRPYVSIGHFFPTLLMSPRRVSDTSESGPFTFPRAEGKRYHSYSAGQPSPYDHILSSSRSQSSGGGYSRQYSNGDRSTPGRSEGGGGSGGGRDNRDWSGRKSSDGGSAAGGNGRDDAGDDGRRSGRQPIVGESFSEDSPIRREQRSNSVGRSTGSLRAPRPSVLLNSGSDRRSGDTLPPTPHMPQPFKVHPTTGQSPRQRVQSSNAASSSFSSVRPSVHRVPSHRSSSSSSKSDSDDVPLAKRIPGALTAQKSIRKQARETRSGHVVHRQHSLGLGLTRGAGVPPEELMSKLLRVQHSGFDGRTLASHTQSLSQYQDQSYGIPSPNPRPVEQQLQSFQLGSPAPSQPFGRAAPHDAPVQRRRQQSLGPRNERPSMEVGLAPPPPRNPSGRHSADSGNRSPSVISPKSNLMSLALSRESSGRSLPQPSPADGNRPLRSRAMTITQGASIPRSQGQDDQLRRARSTRDKDLREANQVGSLPPPPLPSTMERAASAPRGKSQPPSRVPSGSYNVVPVPSSPMPPAPGDVQQQRVFIADLQRFVNVEITATTTAEDVIEIVAAQGELRGRDWMLWELANEFGMERPIRDFERLSDVFASWNVETRLNALMLKRTSLASALSRRAMPNKSPVNGGYVNWEAKRGKWSKRWLELREHSLFLAKKDNGKDETFLCNLSSFDGYLVKRMHKAPKPFVFAVKSTDNISMFENPADCVNVFSCDLEEGSSWLEKILVARSYALYKERNVLFQSHRTGVVGASVERSNTRRTPNRTLVGDVSSPSLPPLPFNPPTAPSNPGAPTIFSEGSLLARSAAPF